MKIAIVEDNPADSRTLEALLKQFFLNENIPLALDIYTSGEDIFVEWPLEFDIVFLDIQLDKLNGIDIASKSRETNERVIIIFITNNPQYSLMGYSVEALDYIIKPITKELLARVLNKAIRRLGELDHQCITIHNNDGYFVVNPRDIHYIEVKNRKLVVYTSTGSITCLKTLQSMEEQLPNTFFRCHSAFLININAVESVKGAYAVVAGTMIPISKHRRKDFISLLTALIGEKI
jgi:DNA-binding LytR/AlgR family response regulator